MPVPAVSQPPDEVYGQLFEMVQRSRLFEDSKTFVDAVPTADPASIVHAFEAGRRDASFDLKRFVAAHFIIPPADKAPSGLGKSHPLRDHIELLWDVLQREADDADERSSLIPLPHPYLVPGGRFREVYYWDSYFTMLGLIASGRVALMQNMVDNFAYLIDRIGFVTNGNRSYYCTRSQPPMFASMLNLLADVLGRPEIFVDYLGALEKEYRFWMSGSDGLGGGWPCGDASWRSTGVTSIATGTSRTGLGLRVTPKTCSWLRTAAPTHPACSAMPGGLRIWLGLQLALARRQQGAGFNPDQPDCAGRPQRHHVQHRIDVGGRLWARRPKC